MHGVLVYRALIQNRCIVFVFQNTVIDEDNSSIDFVAGISNELKFFQDVQYAFTGRIEMKDFFIGADMFLKLC